MAAIYLAPFYLLVCVYILLRSLHWFQVLHTVFQNVWVCRGIGLVYLFVVFSILIAFMAPASGFRRFMKLLSNYWLGVLMYTLMTLGIADGLRLLLKHPLRNLGFPGRELLFKIFFYILNTTALPLLSQPHCHNNFITVTIPENHNCFLLYKKESSAATISC